MNGHIPTALLADRKRREEKTHALVEVSKALNHMIQALRVAQHHNRTARLELVLPDERDLERQLLAALTRCAEIYKHDQAAGGRQ